MGTNEKGSHESMTVGTGRWAHGFIIPSLYFCMFENFPKYKENNKKKHIKKGTFVQILLQGVEVFHVYFRVCLELFALF